MVRPIEPRFPKIFGVPNEHCNPGNINSMAECRCLWTNISFRHSNLKYKFWAQCNRFIHDFHKLLPQRYQVPRLRKVPIQLFHHHRLLRPLLLQILRVRCSHFLRVLIFRWGGLVIESIAGHLFFLPLQRGSFLAMTFVGRFWLVPISVSTTT